MNSIIQSLTAKLCDDLSKKCHQVTSQAEALPAWTWHGPHAVETSENLKPKNLLTSIFYIACKYGVSDHSEISAKWQRDVLHIPSLHRVWKVLWQRLTTTRLSKKHCRSESVWQDFPKSHCGETLHESLVAGSHCDETFQKVTVMKLPNKKTYKTAKIPKIIGKIKKIPFFDSLVHGPLRLDLQNSALGITQTSWHFHFL